MAVRILNGEKPGDIPVVKNANVMMFDWRAIKRWGLIERELPPGSIVINRQPTVWEAYKQYITSGIATILAESLLIFGLLWQRKSKGEKAKSSCAIARSGFGWRHKQGKCSPLNGTSQPTRLLDPVTSPVCSALWTKHRLRVSNFYAESTRMTGRGSPPRQRLKIPNVQMTYRMLGDDGSVIWLEKTARAFFDDSGRMVRKIGMVSAITERKRSEEILRESEEKFRSVFRDAGVGMVIVSPEGRFLAANGRFCDDFGYTEEELLGKSVESITFPDDWPAFSKRLSQALAGGDRLQRFEKRCVLPKTGRIVYTETTASLIRSRDGKPRYFVGGVLDVTNRREAEETLSNNNRRLIEAQEQERTRIGRELHDDISQRLALLAVELEQLLHNPSKVQIRLAKLQKEISDISDDVEALSHELHSSKLTKYLGAVAGIRSWCREF